MILISTTYEIVTPESAEHGEAEENGMERENEPVTFRELVDLMREHPQASCSGPVSSEFTWFSSYPEQDCRTGEERSTSLHYSRENPARNAKYWSKAARFAGVRQF